jgi:hypothetical protein
MIRYAVRCASGHEFEGWFRDSNTFERQARAKAILCPQCGSAKVERAPMAPALAGTRRTRGRVAAAEKAEAASGEKSAAAPAAPAPESPAPAAPEHMHIAGRTREMLQEMRRHIERTAEHVGDKFADEARKIHRGEAPERSIYGDTTDAEAEALSDEGVPFGRIPWPKLKHDA